MSRLSPKDESGTNGVCTNHVGTKSAGVDLRSSVPIGDNEGSVSQLRLTQLLRLSELFEVITGHEDFSFFEAIFQIRV